MKSISHQGVPLIRHLESVANSCRDKINSLTLEEDVQPTLAMLGYICGAFHDLGKATVFFQEYILSNGKIINGPKNHALISSLFVKEISRLYLEKIDFNKDEQALLSHFCFTSVKRHHGKLSDFQEELTETVNKTDELKEQIDHFNEADVQQILDYFLPQIGVIYTFDAFKKYIKESVYDTTFDEFRDDYLLEGDFPKLPTNEKIKFHFYHQLLFSTLLLSDKSDVILKGQTLDESAVLGFERLQKFRKENGFDSAKTDLNAIQNEAFFNALNHLKKVFSINQHIYSLTLPTGIGKTMTSFGIALKLRELLGKSCSGMVVAIPFTSIIDQNFQVYERIIANSNSTLILKHHHLAEPKYKLDDDELEIGKSSFLIETWQSQLVVTTFVQLLNSIFSNDKSLLMKLPALANSIIILDEVQSIPYKYWELVKNALKVIGSTYKCYFILMSATQPLIFNPENEIIELVPDFKKYFTYFNRTRIVNKLSESHTIASFGEEVMNYLEGFPEKDCLIILNTKGQTREVFKQLCETETFSDDEIYYLSTLITPHERKRIFDLIKRKSKQRKIIVSTQLIEAGVDISVDAVFRCIAPLDSIIQAAGRANRYNEKRSQGEVYLYDIDELKKSSSLIYGAELLQKTRNIFKNIAVIEEKEYLKIIESYFKEVRKQSDATESYFFQAIQNLEFKTLGQFKLIEEELETESVFIQLNEEAKKAWESYVSIYTKDIPSYLKKQEFSKIKSVFYDYVINVPVKRNEQEISFDSPKTMGFYVSEYKKPSAFYKYHPTDFKQNIGYSEPLTIVQ
ncbi:CRISPR-associated helicase Cas3' [Marinilongibacter aquaticus]|uniref:CRISPR-associated helicase Cas3' n=1 Tax=Marinilongibacter aquaticus TaxID=2975157 RepID=UPI0021BD5522|nr:CRISPR-associated helicase Cas3' [Marinilongibacter aquaticus]UBM60789.1 CRISPR-associated helicase Cas3' [Marinilongibacter aquaticus]